MEEALPVITGQDRLQELTIFTTQLVIYLCGISGVEFDPQRKRTMKEQVRAWLNERSFGTMEQMRVELELRFKGE